MPSDFEELINNLKEISWFKKKQHEKAIQRTAFFDKDIGWKLPTLSLRYLFQNNCLLFGRILHVVGEEKSGKTSFCFDLIRRFINFGVVAYIETEGKLDRHKLKSFLFSVTPEEIEQYLYLYEVNNLDEAIGSIIEIFKLLKDFPQIPLLLIIDSLRGVTGEDVIKSTSESGIIERTMPIDALKITKFLEIIRPYIRNKPYIVVITNHLKRQKNPYNPYSSIVSVGGGKAIGFFASWKIEIIRDSESKSLSSYHLNNIVKMTESNLCESGKEVPVTVVHTKIKTNGSEQPASFYDWETASVNLLTKCFDGKLKEEIDKILQLEIKFGKHKKPYVVSPFLNNNEPVPIMKAGALLEEKELEDKISQVENLLNIVQSLPLEPGKTIEETLETYMNKTQTTISKTVEITEKNMHDENKEEISDSE